MLILKRGILLAMIVNIFSYGYVSTTIELFEKVYLESRIASSMTKARFTQYLLEHPYDIKAFMSLGKYQRMQLYMDASKIPITKQTAYLRKFNALEDGDKLLINAIKQNKNLDDVYKQAIKSTSKRRRITKIEKSLMNSNNPRKDFIFGRSVTKRDIFQCSKSNIALMKKGLAPIGKDGYKVNLHHLKQQKSGDLVELTQTEHNQHSSVLHRYVRNGSEITDRGSDFQIFKKQYWKSRAVECMARGR